MSRTNRKSTTDLALDEAVSRFKHASEVARLEREDREARAAMRRHVVNAELDAFRRLDALYARVDL